MNKPSKTRWMVVPCPDYDVEGLESWLEEQAGRGLFLSEDGFFLGFACFTVDAPRRARYRLEAAPKERAFSDFPDNKDAAISLMQEMGWQFVTEWREFLIYCTFDSSLPELNTDPAVQAISLKRVQSALSNRLFSVVYWLAIHPALNYFLRLPAFLLAILTLGTFRSVLLAALTLFLSLGALTDYLRLRKLRKKLRLGEPLQHGDGWKKRTRRYLARRAAEIPAMLLWVVLFVQVLGLKTDVHVPLESFGETIPFARAEALLAQSPDVHVTDLAATVHKQNDLLAPEIFSLHEYGSLAEGGSFRYQADYYALRTDALAARLAEEIYRCDLWGVKRNYPKNNHTVTNLDAPDIGADQLYCFRLPFGEYRIILQSGRRVLSVSLFFFGDADFSPQEAARTLLDSIKSS